jgi:hypothetical protein
LVGSVKHSPKAGGKSPVHKNDELQTGHGS